MYLLLKALHLWMIVSWFAGLFYLPRIFVNLAMVEAESEAERQRLLLMAGKLYRFMTPLGVIALLSGLWMWWLIGFGGIGVFGWLYGKALLAALLIYYHYYCGRLLAQFRNNSNSRSHVWFRWFNEAPVIILLVAIVLVVWKPS